MRGNAYLVKQHFWSHELRNESPSPRTRKTSRNAAAGASIDISDFIDADEITEAHTEQLNELDEATKELKEIRTQTIPAANLPNDF